MHEVFLCGNKMKLHLCFMCVYVVLLSILITSFILASISLKYIYILLRAYNIWFNVTIFECILGGGFEGNLGGKVSADTFISFILTGNVFLFAQFVPESHHDGDPRFRSDLVCFCLCVGLGQFLVCVCGDYLLNRRGILICTLHQLVEIVLQIFVCAAVN